MARGSACAGRTIAPANASGAPTCPAGSAGAHAQATTTLRPESLRAEACACTTLDAKAIRSTFACEFAARISRQGREAPLPTARRGVRASFLTPSAWPWFQREVPMCDKNDKMYVRVRNAHSANNDFWTCFINSNMVIAHIQSRVVH